MIMIIALYYSKMNTECLFFRDHQFDIGVRKKPPKRKNTSISKLDCPARGTQPIRELYRKDESKILPHIRQGLSEADL